MIKYRLSVKSLYFLAFLIVFFKILAYFFLYSQSLGAGGASDANYYHAYAMGVGNYATSLWPVLLRYLNDIGFYDRNIVAVFSFFSTITLAPYLLYKVIIYKDFNKKSSLALSIYIIFSLYPTLYFFTFDIYRDVFMFCVVLLSWFFLKRYYDGGVASLYNLIIFFALGYLCFLIRHYLGFSAVVAFFIYYFYSKTSRYIWLWIFLYLLSLMIFQSLGLFNSITEYRGVDGFEKGASTLGIGLHGRSSITFVGLYIVSFLGQVFGLFIVNAYAVVLFIVESVPFILALRYIFKNKIYMSRFCHYLLAFFVIYTTIWVIGNDNLGTAVRLRFHSYMAIFICFFIVYQNKSMQIVKNKK